MPLSIVGVWPLKNTYLRYYLWASYGVLQLIMACADLVTSFGDIESMIMNFVTTSVHSMICVRMIVFHYSKRLTPLIIAVKNDMCPDNYEPDEEMQICYRYYSSAVFLFKIIISGACCTSSMYFILPLEQYFTANGKGHRKVTMVLIFFNVISLTRVL